MNIKLFEFVNGTSETLALAGGLGDFFLVLGILLWSRIMWKKGKEENEKTD